MSDADDEIPRFLIVGAQKSGTSSLYAWMTSHPDVVRAPRKELHFFDANESPLDIDAYRASFELERDDGAGGGRPSAVTGEATPIYLFDPRVPGMVAEHLPDVRLIVLLRDPAERAVSHHRMSSRRDRESLPLREAVLAEEDRLAPDLARLALGQRPGLAFRRWSYVSRGRYAEQLRRWFEHFPREQFLVIDFDHLVHRPDEVYRSAIEFIGVDPDRAPMPQLEPRNVGSDGPTPSVPDWLPELFEESNRDLRRLMGTTYSWM